MVRAWHNREWPFGQTAAITPGNSSGS